MLCCRIQHVFDEDAISGGGVVDKNVSNSADQLAVLNNRRAGHALHDAAGGGKQLGIGDPQQQIAAMLPGCRIDLENLHRIFSGNISLGSRKNHRRPRANLLVPSHGQRFALDGDIQLAEYTQCRVARKATGGPLGVSVAAMIFILIVAKRRKQEEMG